ncbi:hypothetical protein K6Q96_18675 [Grimontia kaedaensis]|uniref:Uncharacterized protein n=1 Tax=Grimontia kaedaensis TaxID=2872157 RepID=A0ABY4X1X9_9GAMM|nr:hypothetical protein [Grimontia kaedaensis]USH05242.1 hypothetical protein K6Q96_18675 [Grimontia kaedaensis]
MSYDVTFHSISKYQLNYYFFDLLNDETLINSRVNELTSDLEEREIIKETFKSTIIPWYKNGEISEGHKITSENFNSSFSYVIACISGHLNLYFYSRNACFSLIQEDGLKKQTESFFECFSSLEGSPLAKFDTENCQMFIDNYSASGVIKNVSKAKQWLISQEPAMKQEMGDDAYEALLLALTYCEKNDLYFFEASDVITPLTNDWNTNIHNLRSKFQNNLYQPKSEDDNCGDRICFNCNQKITMIDILKAGLPNKISCSGCKERIYFNFKAFPDYIALSILMAVTLCLGFLASKYIINLDILTLRPIHIYAVVISAFILVFDIFFSTWLLKHKRVVAKP